MKKNVLYATEAIVQLTVLLALYPVWFILGLYARMSRRDKFYSVSYVCGIPLFPAFGKWYLPMIWFNWHY